MSAIDSIARVCKDYCQTPQQAWYYAGSLLIGGVIGWFANTYKVFAESRKLKEEAGKLREERTKLETENAKLRTDAIKNKNEIESKHNDACVELDKEIDALIESVRNQDAINVDLHREASCRIIADKVLLYFKQLSEMKIAIYKHPDELFRGYIFKELVKYAEWLNVINNQTILDVVRKEPLRISHHYFFEFSQLIRDNISDGQQPELLDRLQLVINEMSSSNS